ncbi:sensor histidine kinase [Actinomyces dentalis]|uniref:sensor histidine kinase n=1 Tax=Actinomyces dentalis TaxID=272548 RepID=UPI00047E71A9|nr:HAMP domain-containing sensor histidine kinase [Actinomyces dentalis]
MSRHGVRRLVIVLVSVGLLALAAVWTTALAPLPRPDAAALNLAVHTARDHWESLSAEDFADVGAAVTVIGRDGAVRLRAAPGGVAPSAVQAQDVADGDAPGGAMDGDGSTAGGGATDGSTSDAGTNAAVELLARSAAERSLAAPVVVDGALVGVVVVDDRANAALRAGRTRLAVVASAALVAVLAPALVAAALLHRRVVAPFRRLEAFAHRVARGDLDRALPMDRGNVFGAWSESFDLMRTELRAARAREQEARASKERLVADIGHDIRTPLATITATAELIRATTADAGQDERLALVVRQAHRIDSLVTDLVRTHGADDPALALAPVELPAERLAPILTECDHLRLVDLAPLPQALVRIDPGRLAQVVGNVVTNSYKYAGTRIDATARVLPDEPFLELRLADHGPGAPEAELALLTRRGHRGPNAEGTPGQGLGLHTAADLMERMGGGLDLSLGDDGGLVVGLMLPLA